MNRNIYFSLKKWKDNQQRRPLLLRGARQTGKTYIVNSFGKKEFENLVTLNFERNPEFKDIFTTFIPSEIIERIVLYSGKRVVANSTLLFLDEIQDCPNAIISLRYFY